jgi:hypothetical protein
MPRLTRARAQTVQSRCGRLIETDPHRGGDLARRAAAARRRQPSEAINHPLQTREQTATFGALTEVVLEPRAERFRKITVDVRRHLTGGPPVVALEAGCVGGIAHQRSDPLAHR